MQIGYQTSYATGLLGLDAVGDSLAVVLAGGQAWLVYGTDGAAGVSLLPLGPWAAPGAGVIDAGALGGAGLGLGQGLAVQTSGSSVRIYSFADGDDALTLQILDPATGALSAPVAVTAPGGPLVGVTTFEVLGGPAGSLAALGFAGTPGLTLYTIAPNGNLVPQAQVVDTPKSYLGNVSDTLALTLLGQDYLITLSSLEGGLTSLAVDEAGQTELVDSLGTIDGLPLAGATAMAQIEMGGVTYLVVTSPATSALTVVRVNDMGCLFATDTIYDDRTTRFAHAEVLDTFTWAGRSFVVTGGTDAGITVLEMRPDGQLVPLASAAFETGAGLGPITGIEAVVSGASLQIYVVDASNTEVMVFGMDLSSMGGMVAPVAGLAQGGAKGEMIWGGGAAETLLGAGGEDWLYDGAGQDVLTGGAGADVFVLAADGQEDLITDFALHQDRIDLSDWGGVYAASALVITPTANGAVISGGGQSVTVVSANGASLSAASFTDADFIFV